MKKQGLGIRDQGPENRIGAIEGLSDEMKSMKFSIRIFALSLLLTGVLAQASTVTGTVTNKTTGKPAAGDPVVLVDVQAGMGEVAKATTDSKGHYSLVEPGSSPYLVRVTHQGAGYFVAAPQGATPADITVYDVAPKVQGVSVEADVIELETENDQLKVTERFFVHNLSSPPTTQWSSKSFEVVLPAEAQIDGVGGQRPNGLPTTIKMDPDGPKGHYAFNFPIQPDDGDKDTLFQLSYHIAYSGGMFTFHSQELLPADNLAVLMPKSMTFTPASGLAFKNVPEDPNVQTFVLKNAVPGKVIDFTISGSGSIPRDQQGTPGAQQPAGMGGQAAGGSDAAPSTGTGGPGGGLGPPVKGSSPLPDGAIWWILGGVALLLVAGAAFMLRKPAGVPGAISLPEGGTVPFPNYTSPATKQNQLLTVLKEEMFTVESEKIHGTITAEEYARLKDALETVLKRALNKKQ